MGDMTKETGCTNANEKHKTFNPKFIGLVWSFSPMCKVMCSFGLNANSRHERRWHIVANLVYPSLGHETVETVSCFHNMGLAQIISLESHMYCEAATASIRSGSGMKTPWDLQTLKKVFDARMVNFRIWNSRSWQSWSVCWEGSLLCNAIQLKTSRQGESRASGCERF